MNRIKCSLTSARIAGLMAGLAVSLLLFAVPASAQDFDPMDASSLFGTDTGDPFTSIFLNQLFGPLFPAVDGTTSTTVFSEIIGYFNIIILVVGGMMFFYNATVGIMQSAHEGKVLGQRWSSLWAPLRVIFAVGLLVPVPGLGGYNLVQSGVAYVVKGSTNIASLIWTESARMVIGGSIPITTAAPSIPPAIISDMYANAACRAIVNEQMRRAAPEGTSPLRVEYRRVVQDERTLVQTEVVGSDRSMREICGGYSTPDLPAYITNVAADEAGIGGLPVEDSRRSQVRNEFITTHLDAMENIQFALDDIAEANLPYMMDPSAEIPDISGEIAAVVASSREILRHGVDRIIDLALGSERNGQAARDALLSRIEGSCSGSSPESESMTCYGEGWIGAGSWYMMLAQLNNEISTLTGAEGSVITGSYIGNIDENNRDLYVASGGTVRWYNSNETVLERSGMASAEEAMLANERYKTMYENSTASLAALGFPMSTSHLRSLNENVTSNGILDKVPGYKTAFRGATEFMVAQTSPSNFGADPMIGLTVIGKLLIGISGVLMAVAGLSGFFSGGAVATVLSPFISVLLTAGSTLAYILPMTPFLFWVLAVTGYFLLIVEAIVAVNLWALAHMRLDGEGISGQAGERGWLMLLSLLMTPVLMIIGFLVGMTIFRITSSLLDLGFNQAISGIMGGGLFNGLVAMVVYSVLIAVMYMVLLERSFSLVTEFPGRILAWMGASAELTKGEENRARVAIGGAAMSMYRGGAVGTNLLKGGAARVGDGKQVQGAAPGTKGMLRAFRDRRGDMGGGGGPSAGG